MSCGVAMVLTDPKGPLCNQYKICLWSLNKTPSSTSQKLEVFLESGMTTWASHEPNLRFSYFPMEIFFSWNIENVYNYKAFPSQQISEQKIL